MSGSDRLGRSFLLGRTAGDAVVDAQRETLELLWEHNLLRAAIVLKRTALASFHDFMKIRSAMLAGGVHCARINGGRTIDA